MSQEPKQQRDYTTVIEDDLRPAGDGKHCFYCAKPLGGKHTDECVIRQGAGWFHVAIRENATGEVRLYRYDFEWSEASEFIWTEGNYACDCNRRLSFLQATGPGPADDQNWMNEVKPCGDTMYSALYAELPDGTRYPLDDVE